MSGSRKICVYCASSSLVDQKYKDIAHETGAAIVGAGHEIVYGGGHVGLMGILADSALALGGRVTGVIPKLLQDLEVAHQGLSALHVTHSMQERQFKMAELSDAFVILPGGLGTLAEFFEIVTWKQLGLHDKPISVLNAFGYWDHLLEALEHAREERFLRQKPGELYQIVRSVKDLETSFL